MAFVVGERRVLIAGRGDKRGHFELYLTFTKSRSWQEWEAMVFEKHG